MAIYINKHSELWEHTVKRVDEAKRKSKSYEDFVQKMVTRLKRIKHEEKIHYAIRYLKDKGYDDVVDIYEGRLLLDHFLKTSGQ